MRTGTQLALSFHLYPLSTTCHPETGLCVDCEHNTIGDYCELCTTGYFGDPLTGACARSCARYVWQVAHQRACNARVHAPTTASVVSVQHWLKRNVDMSVTTVDMATRDSGVKGDTYSNLPINKSVCCSCMEGFYGDPQEPAGTCAECNCHRHGALSQICDRRNGACVCRPGVTGRDCSRCQPRHALIGPICARTFSTYTLRNVRVQHAMSVAHSI
jgi:laminin alpha 1/2